MNCLRKGVRWKLLAAILLDCICLLLLSDYSISVRCSNIITTNQHMIMTMGEKQVFLIFPFVMACEQTLCTNIYEAPCSTKSCPLCKLYAGPADRFQVKVFDANGQNISVSCDISRLPSIYMATCIAKNTLANLTKNYALRVFTQQVNGTVTAIDDTAVVTFRAGNISVKNSGPGAWTSGSNLAVGEGATFVFPVKDAFNNVKKRSTGAASQAEFEQAFGQFDARIRNHVLSLSMNYNTETGYANFTFIPTTLGTWPLFLGKEEAGILGTPYEYRVTKSGLSLKDVCHSHVFKTL